jgi:ABC-type branched-subunit amino acid transport system ATPase component
VEAEAENSEEEDVELLDAPRHAGVDLALQGVSLVIDGGELVWVCGRVGAGKTSLILACLGELTLTEGSIEVTSRALYCPQLSAIVTGSIIDNITWGLKVVRLSDSSLSQSSLAVCAETAPCCSISRR